MINYKILNDSHIQEINKLLYEEYDGKIQIEDMNYIGYGCFNENELVSMAFLAIYNRIPCDDCTSGKIAELCGVYTLIKYRGNKYGTECCKRLIEYARKENVDYIGIDAKLKAYPMYERIGFFQLDTEKRIFIRPSRAILS